MRDKKAEWETDFSLSVFNKMHKPLGKWLGQTLHAGAPNKMCFKTAARAQPRTVTPGQTEGTNPLKLLHLADWFITGLTIIVLFESVSLLYLTSPVCKKPSFISHHYLQNSLLFHAFFHTPVRGTCCSLSMGTFWEFFNQEIWKW